MAINAPSSGIPGYDEFELNLEVAILEQLPPLFERLSAAPLTLQNVHRIDINAQGAYHLFLGRHLVYVGKSDAELGLRNRLERHFYRIQHRKNLLPADVTFKAVRVYSFNVMDVETILIGFYGKKKKGVVPEWNNSGFGSNDPGRERDTQKPSKFDSRYPLDIDVPLKLSPVGLSNPCTLGDALAWLRKELPYTFRFGQREQELQSPKVNPGKFIQPKMTMRNILEAAIKELPKGWQATALNGYCILYKEQGDSYKNPTLLLRS
jgi:hypothetical protein